MNSSLDPLYLTLDAPLASATKVTGYTVSPVFGQATRARDPRQIQFGLKLVY